MLFAAVANDLLWVTVMDASYIPALDALDGAALGGFTSFATTSRSRLFTSFLRQIHSNKRPRATAQR